MDPMGTNYDRYRKSLIFFSKVNSEGKSFSRYQKQQEKTRSFLPSHTFSMDIDDVGNLGRGGYKRSCLVNII